MQLNLSEPVKFFYKYVLGVGVLVMLAAVGIYSYLGSFSRYISDDYCEAARIAKSSPVTAVLTRYMDGAWRAANRYSNLLFVGLGEMLGENNMPITMAGMLVLWPVGLIWSFHEIRKLAGVRWTLLMDAFLGSAFGMLALLQAPNLYQNIYWRSSMMTHFAPMVFGSFLAAFVARQARVYSEKTIPFATYVFIVFSFFILAGFSEPPAAALVTGLGLSLFGSKLLGREYFRNPLPNLLASAFAGSMLGLLVMFFSPARANLNPDQLRGVTAVLFDSFVYSYTFILDSLKVFPVTSALSFLLPFSLAWLHGRLEKAPLAHHTSRFLLAIAAGAPIVVYVLIAASFSPSAYGQGYPVERMRFLAQNMLTLFLFLEGLAIGYLMHTIKFGGYPFLTELVAILFIGLAGVVYPLRAAVIAYDRYYEEFHSRADLWDMRDDYIKRLASLGQKDIDVPAFSGVYKIKELDYDTKNWVNRCAAEYYGLDTIRAITVPDEQIAEFLK